MREREHPSLGHGSFIGPELPGFVLPEEEATEKGSDASLVENQIQQGAEIETDLQADILGDTNGGDVANSGPVRALDNGPAEVGSMGSMGDREGSGEASSSGELKTQKTVGNYAPREEIPTPDFVGISSTEPKNAHSGQIKMPTVGKSKFGKRNQQLSRTEWFRHELDFRRTKKGYQVLIRKRLRWSDSRYSRLVVKRFCPQLTDKMISQIRVGKFSKEAIAALQNGGIGYELASGLLARLGKGTGKRRADLTDIERSLLARIEFGLTAGNRERDTQAPADRAKPVGNSASYVPSASDGDFTEVPLVH